jgi:hypothetical protein
VPKSDNPYVKLLVRLYKFLARKSKFSNRDTETLTTRQAELMRPSTRWSCAAL